ncbi:MAG: hypothetical protein R3268_07490, partial [Acidiferrobacterales bacterium]|nr:hypothetical protein [Acidiferrobacterales bacterium]
VVLEYVAGGRDRADPHADAYAAFLEQCMAPAPSEPVAWGALYDGSETLMDIRASREACEAEIQRAGDDDLCHIAEIVPLYTTPPPTPDSEPDDTSLYQVCPFCAADWSDEHSCGAPESTFKFYAEAFAPDSGEPTE